MNEKLQQELINSRGPLNGEKIIRCDPVSGGCIHKAWKLELSNGKKIFAKTASVEKFSMLNFEADSLKSLKKFTDIDCVQIPEPLSINKFNNGSILLLPWLDLENGNQSLLGKGLAIIHKNSNYHNPKKFGWGKSGYIGSGKQVKGWCKSWGECFTTLRLIPQLKLARKWGLEINEFEDLLSKIKHYLDEHNVQPCLVHGDLWKGNAYTLKNNTGVIIDPATWWADREVDIAMTKLFGGFSSEFYDSYEKVWPLNKKAINRVSIYNLYHILNHANLFGGSYKAESKSILSNLANIFNA